MLNAPLTEEELYMALKQASNGKSHGANDLPSELYRRYSETLVPVFFSLLNLFNTALRSGTLPQSMNEAIIVLLLKPGKDALLPDSYRLISLLTSDVKLLAKVLASRLAKVVHKIVHRDQSCFIPSRSTA